MLDIKNCPLYEKLSRGEPLTQSEKKLLADIVREEIKFLLRNQILPTPKDYERWFYIFCNLVANGQKLEDSVLMRFKVSISAGVVQLCMKIKRKKPYNILL